VDTGLRRLLYLTRPIILGFSPSSVFTCFYFLSNPTTSSGVHGGPDLSAAYWTHTTAQNLLTFLLLVVFATAMPEKKKTSVSCLLSLQQSFKIYMDSIALSGKTVSGILILIEVNNNILIKRIQ
jgi:hypothetical protein